MFAVLKRGLNYLSGLLNVKSSIKVLIQFLKALLDSATYTPEQKQTQIKRLISQGVNINHQEGHLQSTALHIACGLTSLSDEAQLAQVKVLVDNGADPNITDALGRTPLHLAGMYHHEEVYEFLKKKGAKEDIYYAYAKYIKTPKDSLQDAKKNLEEDWHPPVEISALVLKLQKYARMLVDSMDPNSAHFVENSDFMNAIGTKNEETLKDFSRTLRNELHMSGLFSRKVPKDIFVLAIDKLETQPLNLQEFFNGYPYVCELFELNIDKISALYGEYEKHALTPAHLTKSF